VNLGTVRSSITFIGQTIQPLRLSLSVNTAYSYTSLLAIQAIRPFDRHYTVHARLRHAKHAGLSPLDYHPKVYSALELAFVKFLA